MAAGPGNDDALRLRATLSAIAPGTALRDGLERILRGRTGALIVLGHDRTVETISTGGFTLAVNRRTRQAEAAVELVRFLAGPEGQRAITDYHTLDAAGRRAAWLELAPVTGRTHQLRVHCGVLCKSMWRIRSPRL